jgi:methylmalonyl-CoA mutase
LWARIAESYSADSTASNPFIHACTSSYNQTVYDPYVNALRTTTEAFSAVIGGADSICVLPFDAAFRLPDELSRRLARNTHIILKEETHLRELIDPVGGSYFVETLTESLAKAAWKLFQTLEKQGGMAKALINNIPQETIHKTAVQRQTDYHKRKSVLVGTNLYSNAKEEKIQPRLPDFEEIFQKRKEYLQKYRVSGDQKTNTAVLQKLEQITNLHSEAIINLGVEAILAGATLGELTKALRSKSGDPVSVTALDSTRASVLFENLRDASDNFKNKTGAKPSVFLATMGPLTQFKGRADFAKGFFETGGFDIIYPSGFLTPDDAVKAALESKIRVVVICSTDESYPELVAPIVKGIKSKSPNTIVVLAGYPKEQIDQHKQSGIDEFIYLGADVVQILSSIQQKTGVK